MNLSDNPEYQWPPSFGICPECQSNTTLISESYGRYIYSCQNLDCNRNKNWLWYGHPRIMSLWTITRHHGKIGEHFKGFLSKILFLLEDRELIPVMFQCNNCRKSFGGLYDSNATAGFIYKNIVDEGWQKHSNDPTYTTVITCDNCISKNE